MPLYMTDDRQSADAHMKTPRAYTCIYVVLVLKLKFMFTQSIYLLTQEKKNKRTKIKCMPNRIQRQEIDSRSSESAIPYFWVN